LAKKLLIEIDLDNGGSGFFNERVAVERILTLIVIPRILRHMNESFIVGEFAKITDREFEYGLMKVIDGQVLINTKENK